VTILVLAALVVAALAHSYLTDRRRDHRDAALRADYAHDRSEWRDERRELLNRIQPATAQYPMGEAAPVRVQRFEDDSSYWEATDQLALSKEDLAELDALVDQRQRDIAVGIAVASGGEQ
jgi:hypothetical protein